MIQGTLMVTVPRIHHYFVDEAGDLTLYNKRGRSIVGQEGSSKVFMVGVAHLPDPESACERLEALRRDLLADPYFAGVPSMQPRENKTAIFFHAKDDLPEVRRDVFRLIRGFGAHVRVAVRRKTDLAAIGHSMFQSGQKLNADNVYDDLVKDLFKYLLHEADDNRIIFARRGKSLREIALENAIAKAKSLFAQENGHNPDRPTTIRSTYPSEFGGLRVVDYYLWALQRLFERNEARFFSMLQSDYDLIMDLDDMRTDVRGEWYCKSNPLTIQKMKPWAS